eukprot:bmy_16549T0
MPWSSQGNSSGVSSKRDLYLPKVLHKSFVDVNEEGMEVMATTAVIMMMPLFPAQKPRLCNTPQNDQIPVKDKVRARFGPSLHTEITGEKPLPSKPKVSFIWNRFLIYNYIPTTQHMNAGFGEEKQKYFWKHHHQVFFITTETVASDGYIFAFKDNLQAECYGSDWESKRNMAHWRMPHHANSLVLSQQKGSRVKCVKSLGRRGQFQKRDFYHVNIHIIEIKGSSFEIVGFNVENGVLDLAFGVRCQSPDSDIPHILYTGNLVGVCHSTVTTKN